MESPIDELLKKYWKGDSSPEEERRIKEYYRKNPSLEPEGRYFTALQQLKSEPAYIPFSHPGKSNSRTWLSIAATLLLGFMVAFWVIQDARQQRAYAVEDPEKAYEITRRALLMMSSGLNEGKVYTGELNKLNEVKQTIEKSEE